MFEGIYTALVTPFTQDNQLDEAAWRRIIDDQIDAGIDGLVISGTTGESATLSEAEKLRLFEWGVDQARGACKIIAGVGTNDTAQSIRLLEGARRVGADGGLVITPYYNKPTQEGLYLHAALIAEAGEGWPLMLYNVPGRTSVSFTLETIQRLADLPPIVAIKEATADMQLAAEIAATCGDRLTLLSGDDGTALPMWAVGGRGVVSVTSNLLPGAMVALWRAFEAGDWAGARARHAALLPIFRAMFWETSPGPVKALLAARLGFSEAMRPPLAPLMTSTRARLNDLRLSDGEGR
ncbi:4-hydroxy-tetrahydrodipicolinate synthase [Myxococcota bacterium]|nr:4-hydroxy-tetrahydrodipicolinate synthase [Myxococcota bacterium]MBU1432013.1 4-hydroxy-tetrahydrodipicolinate synthase [Myxococcota bacterium]MBU1899614.1 4-hydroxy-tetrahydrodipicolinate synthase [Myxococcota bacterium]